MRFRGVLVSLAIAAVAHTVPARASAEWSNDRSEIELRRFLNDWVRAQNGGDFNAFTSLYGDRFEGTRVSGSQSAKLDRAQWERELQAAFAKPMHVRLYFIEPIPSGDSPEVSFVQVLDRGPSREIAAKKLTLERSGDRLLVKSEETEMSRAQPANDASSRTHYFRFAEERGILWESNVAPDWLPQKFQVKRIKSKSTNPAELEVEVRATISWKSLPESLAAWEKRRISVASATEAGSCYFNVPVVWKHWSGPAALVGGERDEDIVRYLRDEQLDAWTLGAGVPGCDMKDPPAFGRDGERTVTKPAAAHVAARAIAKEAMSAFRKLPQWRALSKGAGGSARTVEFDVPLPKGKSHLVALSYDSGGGCAAWALWKVQDVNGERRFELLNDPGDLTYFYPAIAADVDGDGKPELFGGSIAGGEGLGFVDRAWSASGLPPVDGTGWIPWERRQCEQ